MRYSRIRQRLLDRGWTPVHTDMSDWRHPDLHFHWRTQDALRLEDEHDLGDYDVVHLLGELTNVGD